MTYERSITIAITPPTPLGTFAGFYLQITANYSTTAAARLDGNVDLGGGTSLGGATAPMMFGPFSYADFPSSVTILIPEPTEHPLTYNCVVQSYNNEGYVVPASASPSMTFTLNLPQRNTGSAVAYTHNPTAITPSAATTRTSGGAGAGTGTSYTFLPVTFSPPVNDSSFQGVIFEIYDASGSAYWESAPLTTSPATLVFPTPTTVGTYTVYCCGYDGTNVNPVVPGITPSFSVTLGSNGVVDGGQMIPSTLGDGVTVNGTQLSVLLASNTGLQFASGALSVHVDGGTLTFNGLGQLTLGGVPLINLNAGTIPAGITYVGSIAATQILAGTLGVGVVYAGAINVNQLNAGTLASNIILSSQINVSQLNAGTATFTGTAVFQNSGGTASVTISSGGVAIVGGTLTSPTITGASITITGPFASATINSTVDGLYFLGASGGPYAGYRAAYGPNIAEIGVGVNVSNMTPTGFQCAGQAGGNFTFHDLAGTLHTVVGGLLVS